MSAETRQFGVYPSTELLRFDPKRKGMKTQLVTVEPMSESQLRSGGVMKAPKDRTLSFWQSMEWRVLAYKNGKVIEKAAGRKKPLDATFVKGGRVKALEQARLLWPDAQLPGAKPTKPADDDELVRGDKEPTPKPLEPEETPKIMAKPARISDGHFPRISTRTPRLS